MEMGAFVGFQKVGVNRATLQPPETAPVHFNDVGKWASRFSSVPFDLAPVSHHQLHDLPITPSLLFRWFEKEYADLVCFAKCPLCSRPMDVDVLRDCDAVPARNSRYPRFICTPRPNSSIIEQTVTPSLRRPSCIIRNPSMRCGEKFSSKYTLMPPVVAQNSTHPPPA